MASRVIYILDACICFLCLYAAHKLYRTRARSSGSQRPRPQASATGYILANQVTHARLLPRAARHSFTYPTLSLLVPLSELENGSLDLCSGLLFRYGARWGTVLGLRSGGYLSAETSTRPPARSIRSKLIELLQSRGRTCKCVGDVWMMTMPSVLGFEGINPLTVYFVYDDTGNLAVTVLEVHNTFGEGHAYLLEVGRDEDATPPQNFDHQWTFPRQFFVSPFNDRTGFYTVAIKAPKFASTPRPCIRIHLHSESRDSSTSPGELKLLAVLRAERALPLTTTCTLRMLAWMPLALFITLLRIWYQAFVLHYHKRLNVFPRPEPYSHFQASDGSTTGSCGVIWQKETVFEKYARGRVCEFLRKRSEETGINVNLIHGDPSYPRLTFAPCTSSFEHGAIPCIRHLTIKITSHRFFTDCLCVPSAELIFLLGRQTEGIFDVSSPSVFMQVFTPTQPRMPSTRWIPGISQSIRRLSIPGDLIGLAAIPHPLDSSSSTTLVHALDLLVVCALAMLDSVEERIYLVLGARFIPGYEPWLKWQRARDVRNRLDGVGRHVKR